VPMHIFVDLGQVLRREGNWSFFSEVIDALDFADEVPKSDLGRGVTFQQPGSGDSEAGTPPASPRSRSARETEKEKQRDLDLDPDHGDTRFKAEGAGHRGKESWKVELCFNVLFNISYKVSAASHLPDKPKDIGQG